MSSSIAGGAASAPAAGQWGRRHLADRVVRVDRKRRDVGGGAERGEARVARVERVRQAIGVLELGTRPRECRVSSSGLASISTDFRSGCGRLTTAADPIRLSDEVFADGALERRCRRFATKRSFFASSWTRSPILWNCAMPRAHHRVRSGRAARRCRACGWPGRRTGWSNCSGAISIQTLSSFWYSVK